MSPITKKQVVKKFKEAELHGKYKDAYDLVSGFLSGSSFIGNQDCVNSLNGITYYGLELVQYGKVYNPTNTFKFTIAAQKLTERTTLFYT